MRIVLRGDARRKLVRSMVRPTKVPGVLPHGPAQPPPSYDSITNQPGRAKAVDEWFEKARGELRALDHSSKANEHTEAAFK